MVNIGGATECRTSYKRHLCPNRDLQLTIQGKLVRIGIYGRHRACCVQQDTSATLCAPVSTIPKRLLLQIADGIYETVCDKIMTSWCVTHSVGQRLTG